MTWLRLVRAELRKLTTTKMPWGFLAALVLIAGVDAAVVMFGTDMDGSKTFISTGADQQSLMAFAFNAMIGTALFGAIAVAREYGHHTVVPTFLATPKRARASLAQLTAVVVAGGALGLIAQTLVSTFIAAALPSTQYGFMVSASGVTQVLLASTFSGAIGAMLGAGLGAIIRNVGGAVISGVTTDVSMGGAVAVLLAWGLVPASIGLVLSHRRDVV
jgi:ABC-2 type transport system permease protein